MNIDKVFKLFEEARARCRLSDFVVIGSNSILAIASSGASVPEDMTHSIDYDAYPRDDPGRGSELTKDLGENSPFHEREGIYLDAVSPAVATLPEGWRDRLIPAENNGVRLWCLDPNDAAVSKYARGEPRDLRWIRAGIAASIISPPMVRLRLAKTNFDDDQEKQRAWAHFEADAAKLDQRRRKR